MCSSDLQEATNELQAAYGDDITPEEFQKMLEQLVEEKFDEFVENEYNDQGTFYDEARDQYTEEQRDENDEREWLRENYPMMSDIQLNFDIQWPYYTTVEEQDGLTEEYKRLALDFMNAVGDSSIAVSPKYHGEYYRYNGGEWEPIGDEKPTDCYAIEPDSSLHANNNAIVDSNGKILKTFYLEPRYGDADQRERSRAERANKFLEQWKTKNAKTGETYTTKAIPQTEKGLEFVAPPQDIEKMLQDLPRIQKWAEKKKVTTNSSTGLHMNVSVPNYSLRNLDYVKLAVLLGDNHVLEKFGRSAKDRKSTRLNSSH